MSLVAEINRNKCRKCRRCAGACGNGTIERSGASLRVISELCSGCGACVDMCPWKSVKLVSRQE